ncbi:DNA-binding response OmpR family regulator [Clostridium acetobutylicum]|uniref:Stage 0 sporulation protein A homolog n=1 Tax=Clostridium acetobutylicum (strain ATCC 824 / DSM 792 / JCM 1419 / IAM 19013 / LMG 5710 / NBRC 13948 / NRRL B-527 / VKM B-1787 / 2291 / W) TaxID=272562 RepID=O65994_CLOAB|nr:MULTISPECIES: response regulator transcription factor [Clostridium]AAC12853.1 PhoP [Clostridium acetobutylicum ATCC 824]AAK79473.1 Response regulator (CheY-like receiver domain and a HTH) [Clostridium acetobutylicum ATCC 824]AEI34739.1 response regulator [Clostridium acetobutylicum DSM 1731]AWV81282.1 DNA-binding response regulator [Clostridium acetobutylicum]MBC2392916.1 response regulator transcription factor [Clostridium acetobutylicum]
MINILIIEDDAAISNLIKLNLNMAGYISEAVYNGEAALDLIEGRNFDLILLDIMLPKIDGFSLFQKIKYKGIPVIFLTAKTSVTDKVSGLRMGADDYITKPFDGMELLARIDNVLRHYDKNEKSLKFEDIEVQLEEMRLKKNGQIIDLTVKEFELAAYLIKNKNIVLTRERIAEELWGYDYLGDCRTIDNYIQKIRKKLDWKDKVKTIFKMGYRLEE